MIKKVAILGIGIIFLFTAAGCNMVKTNEERDNDQVVAVVNGTKVYKKDITDEFKTYDRTYNFSEDDQQRKDTLDQLLNASIDAIVTEQKAKEELGIELTDEEKKEVSDDIDQMKDMVKSSSKEQAVSLSESDSTIDVEKKADELAQTSMADIGLDNGTYLEAQLRDKLQTKVKDYLKSKIKVTEQDLKDRYESTMKEEKDLFDSTESAVTTYEGMGEVIVYSPDQIRLVKSVIIPFPEEVTKELLLQATALLDSESKKLQPKIKEVIQKLNDGADIDELIKEYNAGTEDSGTHYVYNGCTEISSPYTTAAMSLGKVGDMTALAEVAPSIYGYHVIKYVRDVKSREIPYEAVKDKLKVRILKNKSADQWTDLLKKWKDESEIEEHPEKLY